jgi:hypothetical protein
MTQKIQLPNGDIAEFPDDMTPDQITGVIQQHLGSTPQQAPVDPGFLQRYEQTAYQNATGKAAPPLAENAGIGSRIGNAAGNAYNYADKLGDIITNAMTFGAQNDVAGLANAVSGKINQPPNTIANVVAQKTGAVSPNASFADLYQQGRDAQIKAQQDFKSQNPVVGNTADIVGMVTSPVGNVGGRYVQSGGNMAIRALRAAGVGAGLGGASAFENTPGDLNNRGQAALGGAGVGAAVGGTLTPLIELGTRGATAAYNAARGVPPANAAVPTNDVLHDQARNLYQAVENSGVQLTPQAMQRLAADVAQEAQQFGYHPTLQPGVGAVMDQVRDLAQNGGSARDLMTLSRIASRAGDAAGDNESQRALAGIIQRRIDAFLPTVTPQEVVAGNAAQAAQDWQGADSLWARYAKSADLDERLLKANVQAAATGSGGNEDNLIRQQFAQILKNANTRAMYSPDELAQMDRVVRGAPGQNFVRLLGKLSPQGNGLMGALMGAASVSNPLASLPFLAGAAARPINQRITVGAANELSDLIRAGGQRGLLQALLNQNATSAAINAISQGVQNTLPQYSGRAGSALARELAR